MMLIATQLYTFALCSCALCLGISTLVECALQIHPFLTNKANLQKSQMNVTKVLTKNYAKMDTWSRGKNKANSKPIQSQNKANSNPIQTQYKAKQTQFQPASQKGLFSLYLVSLVCCLFASTAILFVPVPVRRSFSEGGCLCGINLLE